MYLERLKFRYETVYCRYSFAAKLKKGELMSKRERTIIILIFVFGVLLLLWLARYRYDTTQIGRLELPVRINRFTGKTEYFYAITGRWYSVEEIADKSKR